MYFEPDQFVKNLTYMGVGMLGVFMIIGIIMLATYLIGGISNSASKKENENQ